MEENAYIASIVAGTFYLIASLRLIRLNRRTGERPELLLGCYFGFSGAYYLVHNLPSISGFDSWPPATAWVVEWIYIVGVLPYLFFIRTVFRQGAAWAGVLVAICSAFLLVGTGMGTIEKRLVYSLYNPWFLVQWVGYTTPCAWMCWEALLSRRGATKRARLGLCAPIVANRYLLLALFGGLQVLACLSDLSLARDITENQAVSMVSDVLLGGSEIASVAVLWLAFFPPPFYTNWITRRTAVLPTAMSE